MNGTWVGVTLLARLLLLRKAKQAQMLVTYLHTRDAAIPNDCTFAVNTTTDPVRMLC
jgi:hypothetical protein